jgi:hypothetical protein
MSLTTFSLLGQSWASFDTHCLKPGSTLFSRRFACHLQFPAVGPETSLSRVLPEYQRSLVVLGTIDR